MRLLQSSRSCARFLVAWSGHIVSYASTGALAHAGTPMSKLFGRCFFPVCKVLHATQQARNSLGRRPSKYHCTAGWTKEPEPKCTFANCKQRLLPTCWPRCASRTTLSLISTKSLSKMYIVWSLHPNPTDAPRSLMYSSRSQVPS